MFRSSGLWQSVARRAEGARVLGLWLALAVGAALPVAAGDGPAGTLVVRAEAVVSAVPDRARLSVTVRGEAPEAGEAMQIAAARATAVRAALDEMGIPARDIRSEAVTLGPRHEHRPGQQPRLAGFEASSRIAIRTDDIGALGGLIDALVAAGAEGVWGLSFDLADTTAPMDAARAAAVAEGMRRARLLAEAAGMSLGALLHLEEGGGPPVFEPMMRADAAGGMPVAPGEIEFRAGVTLRFALVPQAER